MNSTLQIDLLQSKMTKILGTNDGWMDGWMNGWMDGWTNGLTDGWMAGWMDGRTCSSADLSTLFQVHQASGRVIRFFAMEPHLLSERFCIQHVCNIFFLECHLPFLMFYNVLFTFINGITLKETE